MSPKPSQAELQAALAAAGTAHHEYEVNYLNGKRDEYWPGWYAAFVLGRLGDFLPPTTLARTLENVTADQDWSTAAAKAVITR